MNSQKSDEILRLENISKRFGGVTALDRVSVSISRGEIHAIVGENGAGKSTLMKLLAGVQEQDSGKVFYNGQEISLSSPAIAEDIGISMVYQELSLFTPLTVSANIFIGQEMRARRVFLDERSMHKQSRAVLNQLMVDIDPQSKIDSLSIGQRQIVEIARAVSRGTQVVIMDEPNSALNQHETRALFDVIRNLKQRGMTILYVSHRLEEVFTISDRITVLRDGEYVGTWEIEATTVDEIVSKVVGRDLGDVFPERTSARVHPEVILSIKELSLGENLRPINIDVQRGEVIGFAGLEGSGVNAIFKIIFGLEKSEGEFTVVYKGEKLKEMSPDDLINHKWAFIPAERRAQGLMLDWSILKNVTLVIIKRLLSRIKLIQHKRERDLTQEYINRFDIATDSFEKPVNTLSGGNQQKVVIAKWLASRPELLILNDPTRGIDVGTKSDIYNLVAEWAGQGHTILFTSSEIEEVLGICDRVFVLYKGEIIHECACDNTDKEEVMRYVLGGDVLSEGIA